MGMMTEHFPDLVADIPSALALAQIADLAAESVRFQTEVLHRLEVQPKSESRLAWEAVHSSWSETLADGIDRLGCLAREILLGEPGVATFEMQQAGCRR